MINEHLSETIIQQYVLDKSMCDIFVHEHIPVCENCWARVKNYQLLFSEIKEIPKPVFEFDIAGLILTKLPSARGKFPWPVFTVMTIIIAGLAIFAYLFDDYLKNIFTGVSMMLLCLIIVSGLIILLFQSIDTYQKYQRKIDSLNFY